MLFFHDEYNTWSFFSDQFKKISSSDDNMKINKSSIKNKESKVWFEKGKKISEDIVQFYLNDFYDEVYIIFSRFVSAIEYNIQVEKILPIEKKEGLPNKEYVFEPSEEEVLRSFIPKVLNIKLYQSLLENSASEHSARMSAMKQASDNAEEMINKLTVKYNRERQTMITQELSEIVSGSEALK